MTTKDFDAVQMMREIREALSAEFAGMSLDEQKRYMREHSRPARPPRKRSRAAPSRPPRTR